MARTRPLKPSFYDNETIAECSLWSRLLLPHLWQLADCRGLLEKRPKRIRASAFPFDDASVVDIDARLAELSSKNLIVIYEVDGCQYIMCPNFKKHARPHKDEEPDERIPMPSNGKQKNAGQTGVNSGLTLAKPESTPVQPVSIPIETVSIPAECPSLPFASFPFPLSPLPSPVLGGEAEKSENPETQATELVTLYEAKVTAFWGPLGHGTFRWLLIDQSVPKADIEAAVINFGAHCDRNGTPPNKRPKATTFFGNGDWRGFVGGIPPPASEPKSPTAKDLVEKNRRDMSHLPRSG